MATDTQTVTQSLRLHAFPETDQGAGQDSGDTPYKYNHLLPTFDDIKYPPLAPFRHDDPGHRALTHQDPLSFLSKASRVHQLAPAIGTEVEGIDLLDLTSDERDQLALAVAQRGVMVFRNQGKFFDAGVDAYREWGSYFGRLHIHPTGGHPAGAPEIHLVYRDANTTYNFEKEGRTTTSIWHTDISFELQPPGLTTFFLLAQPVTGGDTLFASTVNVLKHLSPSFVGYLKTLKAVHSGLEQAEYSRSGKRGAVVKREPVEHVHPLIRRHPVTGEEALYVNRQFTTHIVDLKKEESDNILDFLYDHIAKNAESHVRVHWMPETVVLWDNRVTAHSAIVDYKESKERRHGARITPQAERPKPADPNLILD